MIRVYKLSWLEGLNKRKLTMVYVCRNMTRGGGNEDIDGWLRKVLDTRKGGSEKIRERGSENLYTDRQTDRYIYLESYTRDTTSTIISK